MKQNYQQFLESKILEVKREGFKVDPSLFHESTKPHQRDVIINAAASGRKGGFLSFGMGKTHIQLELSKACVLAHQSELVLIVCPLGVKHEFEDESDRIGIPFSYVRYTADIEKAEHSIHLTTFESVRDGKLDVTRYIMVSLDEASVLRTDSSKTHHTFIRLFSQTKYRYVFTATPSPNDYIELIYYATFLGIMDKGQCKTRFFQRDSTKADKLTLFPHKEREFWLWVSSWSIFITKPSDLGYSDEGYDLPELKVEYHRLQVPGAGVKVNKHGEVVAFQGNVKGLKEGAAEKRRSLETRTQFAINLTAHSDDHWIIWHHLEAERKLIETAFANHYCVSVYGSLSPEEKSTRLRSFSKGEYPILAVKPEIAGSGCNFQKHCHKNVFLGINYKFNDFIQAIHRTQRFGQTHPVEVHIIHTANEDDIVKELQAKWKRHENQMSQMAEIIKKYGLNKNPLEEMRRSIGIERKEHKGQLFTAVNNYTVLETKSMAENSVHMILSSIPFSMQYEYTPSFNDFGHSQSNAHFFEQMDYLTPELLRVLSPGRIAAIHVKDRIIPGSVSGLGFPTIYYFHKDVIDHFEKHGFHSFGMITIETDVVRENAQTYRLGWSENAKDSSKMGVGVNEYLLLFRKAPTDQSNSYADIPVTKSKEEYGRGQWQIDARGKWNSNGNRLLTPDEIRRLPMPKLNKLFNGRAKVNSYDYDQHVKVAVEIENAGKLTTSFETLQVPARYDSVWSDVHRIRTLNTNQTQKREQNHICPLQFDICDRAIARWTNPGETVYDPFAGLHTVPYRAILLDRKGIGVDLNEQYWKDGTQYCREAEYKKSVPTLFDVLEDLQSVAS